MMRSSRKVVTFTRPFRLAGLDGQQPAGSYAVVTDEEPVAELSFEAWRRVRTAIQLPALETDTGQIQMVAISAGDLATAQSADLPE